MKKALIVLLILGVASGLFAQDITWSGSVGTGIWFNFGDDHEEANVTADDDDDGNPIVATLGATYAAEDWGIVTKVKGRFNDTAGDVFFSNAYGYMDFLGGMLNVKGGYIQDGVWSNAGPWIDDNGLSNGGGARIEVKPIDGLNIGALLTFPNGGAEAGTIANFFQQTAFGFGFDGGVFNVAATMRLYSEEDAYAGELDAALAANFGFSGIEIVTIDIGAWIDHLIGEANTYIKLTETFGFNVMDGLGLTLHLIQEFEDGLKVFQISPRVEFAVSDALSIGLGVDAAMRDAGDGLGLADIGVDLWGKYAIGGSSIKAGYGFDMLTADYGDSLNHYIKVIFGYSF